MASAEPHQPSGPNLIERVRRYFRTKQRQLAAMSDLDAAGHPGLVGGHREEIQRIYLREILPKRYEVGRGMVYGLGGQSKEADLVIWDALNYPSLPMADHSFFFAESVRAILEVKSNWSADEFRDVLGKCEAARDVVTVAGDSLRSELDMIHLDIESLRTGRSHQGMLRSAPHIGTAVVFLRGGHQLSPKSRIIAEGEPIDDRWPDLLLLVEPGRLVIKEYGDEPVLVFHRFGEDALLAFTHVLLQLLDDRSVHIVQPLNLRLYMPDIEPEGLVPFPLTRLPPFREALWE